MKFLLRRLGFYLIAAWVSLTLNFFIPRWAPGDPASALQQKFQGKLEPAALEAMKKAFGITDDPMYVQYIAYIKDLARGDLGISVAYFPAPVTEVIGTALLWTLFLAGLSVIFAFSLGTLLGIYSSWHRGGKLDSFAPATFIFLGAFPYFCLAVLLHSVFRFLLGWFPVRHAYTYTLMPRLIWELIIHMFYHTVLPNLFNGIASLGGWLI